MNIESDSKIKLIDEIRFEGELLDCRTSKHFDNITYFLTDQNKIIVYDQIKPIINTIENEVFQMMSPKSFASVGIDTSYDPKILYLLSNQQVNLYDLRECKKSPLISHSQDTKLIYGLKHIKDQFFAISTEQFISLYDIRYPGQSIINLKHYCDENPPNVLGIDQSINDINFEVNQENLYDWDKFTKMNANNQYNIIYGYSSNKNGMSMVFPSIDDEEFDQITDKYFDVSLKNDYLLNIMSLKNAKQKNSYFYCNHSIKPCFTYSNSEKSSSKIRGMAVLKVNNDKFISCTTDSDNHLIFQCLKQNQIYEYEYLPISNINLPKKLQQKDHFADLNHKVDFKVNDIS